MAPESPSVRERRLARELRAARVNAELTGVEAARALGFSASKLSRIETGNIGVSAADLELLLGLYRTPDDYANYLRRLAPSARVRGWWDAYADSLSAGYSALLRLEHGSSGLRCYSAVVPHALLMTVEYARETMMSTWQRPSSQELDRRTRVVVRRQAVLRPQEPSSGLHLSAVIDEAALRRRVALSVRSDGDAIHRGQLEHLATAARWPNVTLQVLPFAAGIPPVSAGSFSILESAATGTPDVVYTENRTRIVYIDAEAEVDRYARDFQLLTEMALPPRESRTFVRRLIKELDIDRTGPRPRSR